MTHLANEVRPGLRGISPALLVLTVLQASMLGALYTKTVPHPPLEIPLFALGPFLSTSLALALVALMMAQGGARLLLAGLACLAALVSFGPHKYFDAAFGSIWPAVVMAQIAVISVAYGIYREIRNGE